jgi:MYND finger
MGEFRQLRRKHGKPSALNGFRSIGATHFDGGMAVVESFMNLWDTGVVGSLPELTKDATCLNPLFVYSKSGGDQCTIESGVEPLLGFHCSSAFVDTLTDSKPYTASAPLKEKVHRLARAAVAEFKEWCISFHSLAQETQGNPTLLSVHHFCGDALEFCYALNTALGKLQVEDNLFQVCAAPWRIPVTFQSSSEGVHLFDAIETSNIADHVGLLNILICALPLLKSSASATCYTETFVNPEHDTSPLQRLRTLLCGDPATVFCLLRSAPVECLTGITSASWLHEEIQSIKSPRQLHYWRFSWKDILIGDENMQRFSGSQVVPSWDVSGMSQALMSIYSDMFQDEEFESLEILPFPIELYRRVQHYSRASFVAFIKFLQSRHRVIWSDLFRELVELVSVSALPMSTKAASVQELLVQLQIQRVYTTDNLRDNESSVSVQCPPSWPAAFRSLSMPEILPLLLRVPRTKCEPIMKEFSPVTSESDVLLEVYIGSPHHLNRYSAVQVAFGNKIREVAGVPPDWKESDDLLVYVLLPAMTTMHSQTPCQISLRLKDDLPTYSNFAHVLGPEYIIFTTSLWNMDHVMPRYTDGSFPRSMISSGISENEQVSDPGVGVGSVAKLSFAPSGLEGTARLHFTGAHKKKLSKSGTLVEGFQNSPCIFGLNMGNFQAETIIPFPFDQSLSRIRIARKSGWVEIIVPFTMNPTAPSFNFPPFPIVQGKSRNDYAWNLPRLSTDLFPLLNLDTKNDLNWINPHLAGAYSVRQKKISEKERKGITTGDDLVDLKRNIATLFISSSGITGSPDGERPRLIFLDMEGYGIMSIIFVLGIRLHPYDNTLVLDSCVFPLVPELMDIFERELTILGQGQNCGFLYLTVKGYKLFTGYIRASVERSRAWSHLPNCDGKLDGGLTQVDGIQQYPCRCGARKDLGEFANVAQWQSFTPFITRTLFTPLFPVPCMEEVTGADLVAKCWTCKSTQTPTGTKLMSCTRCNKARDCSKECQKKDWKIHKVCCQS